MAADCRRRLRWPRHPHAVAGLCRAGGAVPAAQALHDTAISLRQETRKR